MIKKYLEFIKESKIESNKWILDVYEIEELLVDIVDEGYNVDIKLGFTKDRYSYNKGTEEVFTDIMRSDISLTPAYWIEITANSNTKSADVTDSLLFMYEMIKDRINSTKVTLHDDDGDFPISMLEEGNIRLEGDTTYLNDGEMLSTEGFIALFFREPNEVRFTSIEVAKYYEWQYEVEFSPGENNNRGGIYLDIELEDMSDILLSIDCHYKKYLSKNGMENIWDNYESRYYIPDMRSIIDYTLNKENEILFMKALIDEKGGFDETMEDIDYAEFDKEEDLIKYLLKNPRIIDDIFEDFDVLNEVKDIIAEYSMNAHAYDNYKDILNEFDSIVGSEFTYTKHRKEKNGDELTYYRLLYDDKWLDNYSDSDTLTGSDIRDCSLSDILYNWVNECDFRYSMDPNLSDYGDVDNKDLNKEIKAILNSSLKIP